jgi:phosphoenolpyruvate carboxylase
LIQYPDLQNVELVPFNGGGHALQRGGGRMDEVPNTYAKSFLRAIKWSQGLELSQISIQPPILTIQGWQNSILFSAGNASHFFERYFSQAIWAKAKQDNLIIEQEVINDSGEVNLFAMLARQYREIFYKAAKAKYEEDIIGLVDGKISEEPTRINKLFAYGPWVSCNLGNDSSRPSKRNDGKQEGDPLTVEHFKGQNPQLTNQRAIGAEKMCSHSMTHLLTWYSAKEGFEAVIKEYGKEAIAIMYEHDKATRDAARSMSIALFMADFDISWQMFIGCNRPKPEELVRLNQEYLAGKTDGDDKINNQRTLAYLENQANETAKLIYFSITRQEAKEGFCYKDLLKELWPELADEIEYREKYLKFAHQIEARLTHEINEMPPNGEISSEKLQLRKSAYSACDASNAPIGSMNTSTKTTSQQNGKPHDKHVDDLTDEQEFNLSNVVCCSPRVDNLMLTIATNHLEGMPCGQIMVQ